MSRVVTGKCLCGSVGVSFTVENEFFDACHCGMCRRWGGGPLFTVDSKGPPVFTGEDNITRFDSSEWAERGFCKKCGTHLFYRLKTNNFHNLPLGLIEGAEKFKFHQQIFVDHKPTNYDFANETEFKTEAQILAQHS